MFNNDNDENKKKRILLQLIVVLGVSVLIFILAKPYIFENRKSKEEELVEVVEEHDILSIEPYVKVLFGGENNNGYISDISTNLLANSMIGFKNEETDATLDLDTAKEVLKEAIKFEYEDNLNLSNGDKVEIKVFIDNSILKPYNINFNEKETLEKTVKGLISKEVLEENKEDYKIINLFENNDFVFHTTESGKIEVRDLNNKYKPGDNEDFFIAYYVNSYDPDTKEMEIRSHIFLENLESKVSTEKGQLHDIKVIKLTDEDIYIDAWENIKLVKDKKNNLITVEENPKIIDNNIIFYDVEQKPVKGKYKVTARFENKEIENSFNRYFKNDKREITKSFKISE